MASTSYVTTYVRTVYTWFNFHRTVIKHALFPDAEGLQVQCMYCIVIIQWRFMVNW